MHFSTTLTSASILTPNRFSTSALPHWPEDALLPCLATFRPAPATTKAAAVEILNVFLASPPRSAGIDYSIVTNLYLDNTVRSDSLDFFMPKSSGFK